MNVQIEALKCQSLLLSVRFSSSSTYVHIVFISQLELHTVTTVPLEVLQEVHSLPVRGNLYSRYRSLNYWAFYLQSGFSQKQYLEVHTLKKSLEVEPGPIIIAE